MWREAGEPSVCTCAGRGVAAARQLVVSEGGAWKFPADRSGPPRWGSRQASRMAFHTQTERRRVRKSREMTQHQSRMLVEMNDCPNDSHMV